MTSAKYDFGVVGLGRMGASIAGSLALRGCRVAMYDKSHFDREKGWNILSADMKTHVEQGMITPAEKDAALGRGKLVETLEEVVDSVVVVEAIFEDLAVKKELFKKLEEAAGQRHPATIFSTNSMNFDIMNITSEVVSAERTVCGLRFLHPVFFIPDIEVSGPWNAPPQSLDSLLALLKRVGFKPFFFNCKNPSGFFRRRLDDGEVTAFRAQQRDRTASALQGSATEPAPAAPAASSAGECCVCTDAAANALFAPCGHQVMCMPCAEAWSSRQGAYNRPCPNCRTQVERLLRADGS